LWDLAKRFYGQATIANVEGIIDANRGLIPPAP
jgi:phage tail protein X